MVNEFKKKFKYTLRTKEGKVMAQSIVSFGTEDYPFPKNWEEDSMAQLSLIDYKEEFMNSLFDVFIEEGDELDDFDDVPNPDGAFG